MELSKSTNTMNNDTQCGGVSFLSDYRVIANFPCISERYYKHKLFRNPESDDQSNQDLIVLAHSNRISVVTLSPSHDILSSGKGVRKVDFDTEKGNRLANKVKGKWKKGGQKVQNQSVLCSVECDDGSIYKIPACVNGKIVEINRRLIECPSLLTSKPWSDGFIAILLPPFHSPEISNLENYI